MSGTDDGCQLLLYYTMGSNVWHICPLCVNDVKYSIRQCSPLSPHTPRNFTETVLLIEQLGLLLIRITWWFSTASLVTCSVYYGIINANLQINMIKLNVLNLSMLHCGIPGSSSLCKGVDKVIQ